MSIKQMRKKITDKYGENNRVVDKFDKCTDDKTKTKKDIDELFKFLNMFFLEGKWFPSLTFCEHCDRLRCAALQTLLQNYEQSVDNAILWMNC